VDKLEFSQSHRLSLIGTDLSHPPDMFNRHRTPDSSTSFCQPIDPNAEKKNLTAPETPRETPQSQGSQNLGRRLAIRAHDRFFVQRAGGKTPPLHRLRPM
jgi:hypothetical protein